MSRTIVGVLRGGTSNEYNLSLKTGAAIISALPETTYDVRDILIDRTGTWHSRGLPSTPARALTQLDVVLNGIHGGIGEDGTVQRILERSGIPYAGSRALPSGLTLNKIRAREILQRAGIKMPRAVSFSTQNNLTTGEMAKLVFSVFGPPYVIKPPNDGAGHGIVIARTLVDLPYLLADVLERYGSALVEEYVMGDEASVGVIDNFRNQEIYVLPPAHVVHGHTHLTPEHHMESRIKHFVPSSFSYLQKESLIELAKMAHRALSLSHFSRADMIVTPRAVYVLEVNTIPCLYAGASFPTMLESVGSSLTEFLEHSIRLARGVR